MDRSEKSGHSLESVQRTEVFDRNEKGFTALFEAVMFRKPVAYLQKLIDEGADESARCADGMTPLMCSIIGHRQHDTFFFLTGTRNAPLDVGDNDGETPLMSLMVDNGIEYIEQLLKNGANPFIKDKYGKTAREHYLYNGSPTWKPIINLLRTVEDCLLEDINRSRLMAVMMAIQKRVGADSPLSVLDEDTLLMIVKNSTGVLMTPDDIGRMKNGEIRDYVKAIMIKLQT